jgi:hypothetical protein
MAHSRPCENADPRSRCKCRCHGRLHGITGSSADGVRYEDRSGFRGRIRPQLMTDWKRLYSKLNDDDYRLAVLIVDDIAAELGKDGRLLRIDPDDHTVCSIMVETVKALTQLSDALPTAIGAAVEQAVKGMSESGQGYAESAGKIATMLARKAQSVATGGWVEFHIHACRCTAVITCPDIAEHDEVWKYCLRPLIEEKVNDEFRRFTKQMIQHWNQLDDAKAA